MKKNILTVITAALILANLTGCNNSDETPDSKNNISSTESTDSASQPENSAENSEPAESEPEKPELSDEAKALLAKLKSSVYTTPTGEMLRAEDAVDIFEGGGARVFDSTMFDENGNYKLFKDPELISTHVKYDHTYISYAAPVFHHIKSDDLIDISTDEFDVKLDKANAERKWIKIKAGDKLENGLTVTSAECEILPLAETFYYSISMQLSGDLVMEGILEYQEADSYISERGTGNFHADPTVTMGVPILYNNTDSAYTTRISFATQDLIACDGQPIILGKIDELGIDMNDIFPNGSSLARVKITIRDPFIYVDNSTDQMRSGNIFIKDAKVVDIERAIER